MSEPKVFDPKKSIHRAKRARAAEPKWRIRVGDDDFAWSSKMDRVEMIRKKLPCESIEQLSSRAGVPVIQFLQLFGIPQTTYNKKKRAQEVLGSRESEMVLVLTELFDFGMAVFNNEEEKFQRWLKKPNLSLGGVNPLSLFDSVTGVQEVSNSLSRLEYGNLA